MADPVFDLSNEPNVAIGGGGTLQIVGRNVLENTAFVWQPIVTDADGDTLTFSIVPRFPGDPGNLFHIDPQTGALSFINPPDYENPQGIASGIDPSPGNLYLIKIQADDGHGGVTEQYVNIVVNDVANENTPPTIPFETLDRGTQFENEFDVGYQVPASDADPGQTLTWSIVSVADGGAEDAAQFSINPATGTVRLTATPDFENPTDANHDNTYLVTVQVDDGNGGTDRANLIFHVGNVNPEITSYDGSNIVNLQVDENKTAVATVTSTVTSGTPHYFLFDAIPGFDNDKFTINPVTGELSFINAPNFENPTDTSVSAIHDGNYKVATYVTTGGPFSGGTDVQVFNVGVNDVNEPPYSSHLPGLINTSIDENTQFVGGFGTALISDPDAGQILTFSIVPNQGDWDKFSIDPASGGLSFINAPDYENPQDFDNGAGSRDGIYNVTVLADDGNGGTYSQDLQIAVNDVLENHAPTITTINVNGGSTQIDSVGYTDGQSNYLTNPLATDQDAGQTLTWSIVGGADADKFTISSGSGDGLAQIFWVTPPDFDPQREVTIDGGGRPYNNYHVTIQVDDGNGGIDTQDITVGVAQNPWFTSFDGATGPVSVDVNENTTTVATVTAQDNLGSFSYAIDPNVGDADKFTVDQNGVVSFITAPDFENPTDAGTPGQGGQDGVYDVAVLAIDNGGGGGAPGSTSSQALRVFVQDVNENHAPTITTINVNGGSTQIDSVGYTDGQSNYLTNPLATDQDAGQTLTWSIVGGADADKFTISSGSGDGLAQIFWVTPPDFDPQREVTIDGGGRPYNNYHVTIQVDDGNGGIDTQDITVGVAQNPWFTSFDGATGPVSVDVNENTTTVATVTAQDNLGSFSYAIDPNVGDADKFTVDQNGVVSFITAPDFENPTDAGTPGQGGQDGVYDVAVLAIDNGGGGGAPGSTSSQALRVFVQDVNEAPPAPPSFGFGTASLQINENTTSVGDFPAPFPDPNQALTYSIVPNVGDGDKFTIDSAGHLSFINAPDFENPTDVGHDNLYNVTIQATDSLGQSGTSAVEVTVADVNENSVPVFSPFAALGPIVENTTAVGTVHATDPEGQAVTYSISPIAGDGDSYVGQPNLFQVDPTTGAVSFINAPDFENPQDTGGVVDNIYDVWVQASDGNGGVAYQKLSIHVDDDGPKFVSFGGQDPAQVSVAENTTELPNSFGATGETGTFLNYGIVGGADAAQFAIDPHTGHLSFINAPNFESPTDAGHDNIYDVVTQVTDNFGSVDTQTVAVTVSDVNEAPKFFEFGGPSVLEANMVENSVLPIATFATVAATDHDIGDSVTYSIVPNEGDFDKFSVDPITGVVRFINQPDFENPTDVGHDNIYNVGVLATDTHGATDRLDFVVTVLDDGAPTGWQFSLANSNFDGAGSIAAGTVLGSVTATGGLNSGVTYHFATDSSGAGATQTLNGLTIDPSTGLITSSAAISSSSSTWLIAQDAAGNQFAQQFNVNVGTSAANNLTLPAGTTVSFGLGGGDTVAGTNGGDAIAGGAGNDTLNGGVGNDTLSGGAGNDTLNGGTDNDTLIGGVGNDVMHGDDGSDTLVIAGTEAQGDTLDGGTGADTISVAGSGDVTLAGFNAASSSIESWQGSGQGVVGTGAADTFNLGGLSAVNGLAFIDGAGGNDTITGSNFADDLRGGAGNDTLVGLSGNDILTGGVGNDIISGGDGDDVIVIAGTDAQGDTFDGAAGTDTISVIGTTDVTLAALDTASASIETWQGNGFGIVGTGVANAINLSALTTINGLAYVDGGGGDDVVTGSNLADDLRGGTGNDTLSGLAGDDTLTGGVGNDTLSGGDGDDTFAVTGTEAQGDTFAGGAGSDAILVTGTADLTLAGFNAATSSVERWRGNTRGVVGTSANNTFDLSALAAVAGLLYVDGASGNDLITGTALADVSDDLRGGSGDDTIVGLAGNDVLSGGAGNDALSGGDGDDTFLVAGAEAKGDSFNGGLGLDTISVTGTADVTLTSFDSTASSIEAWQGNGAAIVGTTAIDTISLAGLSSISGLAFVDGGGGDDILTGSNLADDLRGGAGNDTLIGLAGNDILSGGAGNDILSGGDGNDTLIGGAGNDALQGGAGDDAFVIAGTEGQGDTFDGGAGTDTMSVTGTGNTTLSNFDAAASSIEVWQGNGLAVVGTTAGDALNFSGLNAVSGLAYVDGGGGNDTIIGTSLADDLRGGGGNDSLGGGAGNDALSGAAGDDVLSGGAGADTLTGGTGKDTFVYLSASEGGDTISGFVVVDDTLQISAAGFGGNLVAGQQLVAGTTFISNADPFATAATGTFLYDSDGHDLLWDADGSGAGMAVQVAHFDTAVSVQANDFDIVA